MIERRCNFCGDLLPEKQEPIKIPHHAGRHFLVNISVSDCSDIVAYNDNPDTINPFARMSFGLFYTTESNKKEDFHTCFGCAAHLVAVAYDKYVKETR